MDIERLNRRIRDVITDTSISNWISASDKKTYCRELLGALEEHELVLEILTNVVQDLMERKAEDRFAKFHKGDGVSILGQGRCIPATIIEARPDKITVQVDDISGEGVFSPNPASEQLIFNRSHDQVFIHIEGHKLSRLIVGRRQRDYSSERISAGLNVISKLTHAS